LQTSTGCQAQDGYTNNKTTAFQCLCDYFGIGSGNNKCCLQTFSFEIMLVCWLCSAASFDEKCDLNIRNKAVSGYNREDVQEKHVFYEDPSWVIILVRFQTIT
jgi:hypothetical protein